jgi:diguanylate cyclase (GGDEF)-like protein
MTLPLQRSPGASLSSPRVVDMIAQRQLTVAFQPIATLATGAVTAHEALVRTPAGCGLPSPDALFAAARAQGCEVALEMHCVQLAVSSWARQAGTGNLFINLSARALVAALSQHSLATLVSSGGSVALASIVVELTEHEQVRDIDALMAATAQLRLQGARLALDDFGDGRSSLRLWSELKPEIVKIDKYFTHDLPRHPEKLQTMRALLQISQTLGSVIVAEGIETTDELRLLRDLGIHLGQGWLLGRPQPAPVGALLPQAAEVIASSQVAVFPERRRIAQQRASVRTLLERSDPITPDMSNDDLFLRFSGDPALRALAIVQDEIPLGLVSRQRFIDRYAKPFFRELHGRKPCTSFADMSPRVVDLQHGLDELTQVLTSEDQRYLSDGFIVMENGQYRGLGSGEQLVRVVTEARMEAARHANPLTLLPGNIPLTQHIQRLLSGERRFAACYCDLNHFKPYNDQYGYWRGDEMILLLSRLLCEHAEPTRDFVGHVGGDDFVVLFQSDDWHAKCLRIIDSFNRAASDLYDAEARGLGGVHAEDRYGVMRFHPLTTLSIGAVVVDTRKDARAEDVASDAAQAKRLAKRSASGLHVMEQHPA